jgi:hypothetical protein
MRPRRPKIKSTFEHVKKLSIKRMETRGEDMVFIMASNPRTD